MTIHLFVSISMSQMRKTVCKTDCEYKVKKVLELYPVKDRLLKFNIASTTYGNVLLLCAWNSWTCSLIIYIIIKFEFISVTCLHVLLIPNKVFSAIAYESVM